MPDRQRLAAAPEPDRRDAVVVAATLIGTLWLAFAVYAVVPAVREAGVHRPIARLRIEALATSDPTTHDQPPVLALTHLVVDGRRVRAYDVPIAEGWRRSPQDGEAGLYLDAGPEIAVLEFDASRYVATFAASHWRGTIRASRDGGAVAVVDVDAGGRFSIPVLLADPVERVPPVVGAVLVSAVFMASLIMLRRYGEQGWLTGFLASLHALYWLALPIGTSNDSPAYAECIPTFVEQGAPCTFPAGYPMFLGVTAAIGVERWGLATTFLQHALIVASVLMLYRIARYHLTGRVAFLAAVLAGVQAPLFTVPQAIVSETLATVTMTAALYFAWRAGESLDIRHAVAAGLSVGVAATARAVPLLALLPPVVILCGEGWRVLDSRRLGAAVAAAAVALLPSVWTLGRSGDPRFTTSTGLHLYNRVITEQKQIDPTSAATVRLRQSLHGVDPTTLAWWDAVALGDLRQLTEDDYEVVLRQVAIDGIRRDPWAYISYTPALAWRMFIAPTGWIPAQGDTPRVDVRFENPPLLPPTASATAWRLALEALQSFLWPALCWLAVAGALGGAWSRSPALTLGLAFVPVAYLLASATVEYFSPRYNAPLVGVVTVLAMIPIDWLLRPVERRPEPAEHAAE
jgi:hypothetical protein